MPILSFNNIPYQVYRHNRMIRESHRFVSFSKQVEFKNSEAGKMGVWYSNIIPNGIHSNRPPKYNVCESTSIYMTLVLIIMHL